MTCRLPQTPRTPTAAAAHYFDDIWAPTGKPKKPHHLRRSSTSRSIGFRSDWETSTNNDEDEPEPINRTSSIGYLDSEELRRKAEIDDKVADYVSDQLERVKSGESAEVDHSEFETSLDGAFEKPKSRRQNGDGDYFSQ
jgi:hypothetical protein